MKKEGVSDDSCIPTLKFNHHMRSDGQIQIWMHRQNLADQRMKPWS